MTRTILDRGDIFRALFEAAADAIVVIDETGSIVLANPGAVRLFGYAVDELVGRPVEMLIPTDRRAAHVQRRSYFQQAPKTRPMGRAMNLHAQCKDGTTLPVDILLSPIHTDDGVLVSAVVRDMTEYRQAQEELQHLADHDALTGLYNRRRFQRELDAHIAQAPRYGGGALLMVDIDNFKQFNDRHGHAAGDAVLCHVAGMLLRRLRSTDVVARYGGDEFALLLPRASREDALLVADEILRSLRARPAELAGSQVHVRVSVGVATVDRAKSSDAVLRAADAALYAAKEQGRDRASVAAACGGLLRGQRRSPC